MPSGKCLFNTSICFEITDIFWTVDSPFRHTFIDDMKWWNTICQLALWIHYEMLKSSVVHFDMHACTKMTVYIMGCSRLCYKKDIQVADSVHTF